MAIESFTVEIIHDPRIPISMEEFVLETLSTGGTASTYPMLTEFNNYRRSIKKKDGKYSSFRAIVSKMKKGGLIVSVARKTADPFRDSKYMITDKGLKRLSFLRGVREP